MTEIRELKERVDKANTLSQLYDIMLEVNESLQDEHIYLQDNKGILDGGQEAEVRGTIAGLSSIKSYVTERIDVIKKNDEHAQRRLYNIKVLLKAGLAEAQYKTIVDMAHNMSTSQCRESGEKVRELLTSGINAECVHPWSSIVGDGEMSPAKCLKCNKVLTI